MQIDLNTLPKSVLSKIPLSIRTFKSVYEFSELPFPVQKDIEDYLDKSISIEYPAIYDLSPKLSNTGDLTTLTTIEDTIIFYLLNYFKILPGSYPFDPQFGCKLKYHLQTKDTSLRQMLLSSEASRIAEVLSADFGADIQILEISSKEVQKDIASSSSEIYIKIKINNKTKAITIEETQI